MLKPDEVSTTARPVTQTADVEVKKTVQKRDAFSVCR